MAEKADASAVYSIDLEDNTSGSAENAVEALNKLKRQIDADSRALADMNKAMRALQGGTSVNIQQFRALKAQIDAKKQSIAQAQSAYLQLGGTFGRSRGSGQAAASTLQEITEAAKGMPGPLGGAASKLEGLKKLVAGNALAIGVAAIAAALIALAVAAAAASIALLKYGIAQAGARRSELLRLEGLTKMRNWWGIAAGTATQMQSAIDKVSGSTALGRDKLEQYTNELYRMGLRGDNLAQALEGAAIKGAVLGDEGAKSFMHWAAGAAYAGGSVKKLTDDVKARFGSVAAAQMLDLNVQTEKLRENFGQLFVGLKIEGLLKAVSGVTALFSQSTKSGQALRALMSLLLQPMVSAIEYVAPLAKRFFQGLIIGALTMAIAVLKVRNFFRDLLPKGLRADLDLTTVALYAGCAAFAALALLGATVVAIFAAMAAPFLAISAAIYGLIKLSTFLVDLYADTDWGALGTAIVEGIVKGLKAGAKWVIDTMTDLGASAMNALKKKLGIASPSKAFAQLGLAIPQGIQTGIESGAPGARSAVAGLVEVPPVPNVEGRPDREPKSRANSQSTINVGGINITTSADTAKGIAADIERELRNVLEGVAIQLGAKVA
jgi:hypothetical protein